jgi:hypothetical protein
VWEVLDTVRRGDIDPTYLSIVKNLRETRNLFVFENYDNYFDMLVDSVLNATPLPSPKKIMNRTKSVKLFELTNLAHRVFSRDNCLVIIEG